MRMIAPEVEQGVAARPCHHVRIAEEQAEFKTVSAAIVWHDGHQTLATLLAFRPSEDERARIAAGEDVYISLLTGGGPMQPIIVLCGKHEAAAAFNVRAT